MVKIMDSVTKSIMKKTKTIGVDIGNFDTKTQNTTTPSGFTTEVSSHYGMDDFLFFNGTYYIPSDNRFPFQRDKTSNLNCFILTLIGISKELIFAATQAVGSKKGNGKESSIQAEISEVEEINLGVGLPPIHMGKLADKLINYYKLNFGDKIEYEYNGYHFSYSVAKIRCYPQDMSVLITYKPKDFQNSAKSYDTFCGIDIGGWTMDIVTIRNKKVVMEQSNSLEYGILSLFEHITKKIDDEFGYRPSNVDIESYLRGGKVLMSSDVKAFIDQMTEEWYNKMINVIVQAGINLNTTPIIFIGGGSLLFEKFIKKDRRFAMVEFIHNPRANAQAYATIMEIKG